MFFIFIKLLNQKYINNICEKVVDLEENLILKRLEISLERI